LISPLKAAPRTGGSSSATTSDWIAASNEQFDELTRLGYRGKRPQSSAEARKLLKQYREEAEKAEQQAKWARDAAVHLGISPEAVLRLCNLMPAVCRREAAALLRELEEKFPDGAKTGNHTVAYQFLRADIERAAGGQPTHSAPRPSDAVASYGSDQASRNAVLPTSFRRRLKSLGPLHV
jgi:hypothetical protein